MPDTPTPLDLDAIVAAIAECRTYNFGMYQADRLAHEHAPALVEEVKRLRAICEDHALCADAISTLREQVTHLSTAGGARPAAAWDGKVVVEAVAAALHGDGCPEDPDEGESCACSDYLREARIAVAVARDHLPVKPSREEVIDALWGTSKNLPIPHIDREEMVTAQADAVLDLLPGRSEAVVKAEALREAADWLADMDDGKDTGQHRAGRDIIARLRDRADRLAAEGGADRG